jgi:hypothetical protein
MPPGFFCFCLCLISLFYLSCAVCALLNGRQIREASSISGKRGYGDLQIGVRVHGVTVQLINDVLAGSVSVPVMRVQIADSNLKLVAFGHSRSGVATVDLTIQFWNGNLLEWEPLLEPCKLVCPFTTISHFRGPTLYLTCVACSVQTASSMQSMNTLSVDHPEYNSVIFSSEKVRGCHPIFRVGSCLEQHTVTCCPDRR